MDETFWCWQSPPSKWGTGITAHAVRVTNAGPVLRTLCGRKRTTDVFLTGPPDSFDRYCLTCRKSYLNRKLYREQFLATCFPH